MESRIESVRSNFRSAADMFRANVTAMTLAEALNACGGYRSPLGILKHTGGWLHVYRSFAFDAEARHFRNTSWPRGLKDTIDASPEYLAELIAWVHSGVADWDGSLLALDDAALDEPHRLHWGGSAPLGEIATMASQHIVFHTGEINALLSIQRGEAWEYTEEVEENHISTVGHGVRPGWMSDAQAAAHEARLQAAHRPR